MRTHLQLTRTAAISLAILTLTTCTGDGDNDQTPDDVPVDAQARLDAAAELLDTTTGVGFVLEGENLPDSGNVILGADGLAAPPAAFDGEIRVISGGLSATVEVVSIDGVLWAKLPFTTEFAEVDAAALGFGDPGALVDPERGVSLLLKSGSGAAELDQVRIGEDIFDQVESTLPGELVGEILAIADPAAEVSATWALDPDTGHLRQAVLTGPFYDTGGDQTYIVSLDGYDQAVDIRAPTQ